MENIDAGTSPEILNIMGAIATFRETVPAIIKDTKVNAGAAGNYSFADLSQVIDKITGALKTAGILYSQIIDSRPSGEQAPAIVTILLHSESKEWIRSRLCIPAKNSSPRAFGGILTYMRRYSLMTALGLVSEDDDASGAQNEWNKQDAPQQTHRAPQSNPPSQTPPIATPMEINTFNAMPKDVKDFITKIFPDAVAGFGFLRKCNFNVEVIRQEMAQYENQAGRA